MSITDPFVVEYYKRRETWIITRGRETFYDENNCMLEFETSQEAIAYAMNKLGAKGVALNRNAPKDDP